MMENSDNIIKKDEQFTSENGDLIQEIREYDDLYTSLKKHTALDDLSEMARLTEAVLSTIGEAMLESDRRDVVSLLPTSMGRCLDRASGERLESVEAIDCRVSSKLGVTVADAREHVVALCQGLIRALDVDVVKVVRARVPKDIAGLFDTPIEERSPKRLFGARRRRARSSRSLNTLASGNPESKRPISGSVPGQRNSPAVTTSPRRNRKISTSDGTPSFGASLSVGREGSERPLSEANSE